MKRPSILVILCLAGFCTHVGFSVLFPMIGTYAMDSFGASESQAGIVFGAFSYPIVITLIAFGILADRIGHRRLMIPGLILCTLAPLFYPLADNTSELILVRVLHGLTFAMFLPAMTAIVVNMAPEGRRGEYIGWFSAATLAGVAVGPAIGGLIHHNTAFLLCSIASGIALITILVGLTSVSPKPVSPKTATGGSWAWLRTRTAIAALLIPCTITIGSGTIAAYIPQYIDDINAASSSTAEAGIIITLMYISSALLRVPAGALSDRIGRKTVVLLGILICVVAITMIASFTPLLIIAIASILFGIGMGTAMTPGTALLADVSPSEARGLTMGAMNTSLQAGLALGPTLMGFVKGISSYQSMFIVCALAIALGTTVIVVLLQRQDPTD
ncbi:MAG: MFS transporter [Chloroflexota bacterium]|nr:MFS transporter [Chloroflexota bacterium]